ncbi:RB1-inducible coiled-coil protein 1 isoform X2 [Anthonomus grandis grandis]|uniref:RB1-inducible coiled-coil protein 1 isoform X2 n=1 Tax=Anthonomus grandis grandis TaxID=2921223 RepID=UPI00216580CE|nr:RB1-inducible coiled-coil protein 1 isoform X2 [Anthonomus grandis grandis]
MVHVFFVQPGDMMTFDNEFLMKSVADLKREIEEKSGIPEEKQVLIISGGEPLELKKNLCSYKAGTDTNPIYLFSVNFDVSKIDISKNLISGDLELKQRLTDCLSLPASLATVKSRAMVAADFHKMASDQLEFCQNLVHEQHLQQQGWSAVIANLEDILTEFRKKWELFRKLYEEFIADRESYELFLLSFEDNKKTLRRIPVLENLLDTQKEPLDSSKLSERTNSTSETEPIKEEIPLYEWICSSNNKTSLDELHNHCTSKLERFENEIMPTLRYRVTETLESADKRERKEIDGIGQRLFDLHNLIKKIEEHVLYQSDLKQSFAQHETRAAQTRDTSILPDLCATHIQQMDLIKQCHQKLMDDRMKIVRAKYELSKSLCTRIEWVQQIENKLWELDSLLVYFHEHLQRLRQHLKIFEQLHLAPLVYMNAVIEVVRRRTFSQLFLMWASDLACQQLTIYNEEMTRRKDFMAQFEGHFLNGLFPGMSDVIPPFAIEAPAMFDAKLPIIGEEDVERLRKELPDFAENLVLPDMTHVINFFSGKTAAKKEDKADDTKGVEDKLIQAVSDAGLSSNLDKNLLKATGSEPCLTLAAAGLPSNLKDDKGCESETDTEEFEKVGQSPLELTFPQKQDASTITQVRGQLLPPKKAASRFFRAVVAQSSYDTTTDTSTTNESFTNIKNISLDSIDELSSIKNFTSTISESCFNSHCNQMTSKDATTSSLHLSDISGTAKTSSHYQNRSKSVSPQSPGESSPYTVNALTSDFATDEYYIDESLPSSVGTGNSQGSEFVRQLDTANIVVAMLQDNLQISRSEHDKLKSIFEDVSNIARLSMTKLRSDLNEFKAQFVDNSQVLSKEYEQLGRTWEALLHGVSQNEKEIIESLRRDNEEERERYRYSLLEKEDVIKRLQEDKRVMEDRIEDSNKRVEGLSKQNEESSERIEELLRQLQERNLEKEKFLKEIGDLKREHKAEFDNIKSRFKLMTMERSPSVTSLEKEKSGDFTSLPPPTTALLAQMTENFELDKERAVLEEQQKWTKTLEIKSREFADEREQLTRVAKQIAEDKDKLIDVLRDRETNMNLEIIKYKTTIQQLAEYQEDNRQQSDLVEEVERLKKERDVLMEELAKVKTQPADSTVDRSVGDASGVPKTEVTPNPLRLNIGSCNKGDLVLIIWDQTYKAFKILKEPGRHPYLLKPECLDKLGLSVADDGVPNKTHCVGEVVEKELCSVLKVDNRFKLPLGSKFYYITVIPRVEVAKPLTESQLTQAQQEIEDTDPEFARIQQLVEDSGIHENVNDQGITVSVGDADRSEQHTLDKPSSSAPSDIHSPKKPHLEIIKFQSTLKQLTQLLEGKADTEEVVTLLKENLEVLEEINRDKMTMSTSVAVYEGKFDGTLSRPPGPSDLSRSETLPSRPHRLNIDSCKVGDVVLLLWDPNHENFKVLQESKHTYFLHSDSLERLGLTVTDGKPNLTYSTGRVIDKEYCKTKKSENRYKVPKGAKFFRVKVSPITPLPRDPKDLSQSYQAAALSTSQSVISVFDPLMEETQSDLTEQAPGGRGVDQSPRGGRVLSESGSGTETHSLSGEPHRPEPCEGGSDLEGKPPPGRVLNEISVSSEKCFAEDSGIVEEATAATENSDRFEGGSYREVEQSTHVSTNWFETMFRSMFSK